MDSSAKQGIRLVDNFKRLLAAGQQLVSTQVIYWIHSPTTYELNLFVLNSRLMVVEF